MTKLDTTKIEQELKDYIKTNYGKMRLRSVRSDKTNDNSDSKAIIELRFEYLGTFQNFAITLMLCNFDYSDDFRK